MKIRTWLARYMRWRFTTEPIGAPSLGDAADKHMEEHGDTLKNLGDLTITVDPDKGRRVFDLGTAVSPERRLGEVLHRLKAGQEAHLLLERPAGMSAEEWRDHLEASVEEAMRTRWSLDPAAARSTSVQIVFFSGHLRARIELQHFENPRNDAQATTGPGINLLDVSEDEDTVKAAIAVADGLDALFTRLGPPPPHLPTEREPLLHGGGGAAR
jgi:hypothetical protein